MGQPDSSRVADGFSSSAVATRRGLDLDQAHGIYIVGNRLVVTKEKSETGIGWDINVGAIFGSFSFKVTPFFEDAPKPVDQLETVVKEFDVDVDQVLLVELKKPSFLSKGQITINMKSGEKFKLLLLNSAEEFGEESFEAARELFQRHLPQALKSE